MKLFEKRSLQVVMVTAAVAVLGLSTPKAAHAVAAALVQVTNTFANPVISQQTSTAASQLVMLTTPGAELLANGQMLTLNQVVPGQSASGSSYVVPTGQNLVVTAMDVTPLNSGTSQVILAENTQTSTIGLTYVVTTSTATVQARYPGIVYPAGTSVVVEYNGPNNGNVIVAVYGYLTAN
jgi:hypothetical protein